MGRKEYFRCAPKREGRKEMRFDHAIFLEGFLSREKEDRSKKGGYRGNRRGLINREGEGGSRLATMCLGTYNGGRKELRQKARQRLMIVS